jgi:hypothetical protein
MTASHSPGTCISRGFFRIPRNLAGFLLFGRLPIGFLEDLPFRFLLFGVALILLL